jgi:hypothetical protein
MIGFVMIGALPLIADVGDVIGIIVFLVIGLLSVVSQIMNKAKEGKQNAGPPPGQRPRAQARPQQQQRSLANEIDQFVQQASQRRGEGSPQQAPRRPMPSQQRAPAQPRVTSQPLVEAVPVELLEPMAEESGSVGSRRLGSLGSRRLESEVDQADENMEEHVHEVFDHKLGQLGRTPDVTKRQSDPATVPPTAAAGLAAMLTDPANVRQAIVLSEILQRPEQRWG